MSEKTVKIVCDVCGDTEVHDDCGVYKDGDSGICDDCLAVVDEWLAKVMQWADDHGKEWASFKLIQELCIPQDESISDKMRSHIVCSTRDMLVVDWDALHELRS